MQRLGIILSVVVAICWGSADTIATVAARRQGPLMTTLISLVVSASVLLLSGVLIFGKFFGNSAVLFASIPFGLLSGFMAAIGYFSLYRGLQLGPLALVSPIVAADGAVAAVLALLLLHEMVNTWQGCLLLCIFAGILIASTSLSDLRSLISTSGLTALLKGGTSWGLLAMCTFGVMLFSISVASQRWGWFMPIFWTRIFATFTLMCIAAWQRVYTRSAAGSLTNTTPASFSLTWTEGGLAAAVGLLETIGLLLYSEATHIAATSIVAAISSCFALIPLVVGMTAFHERPTKQQAVGVCVVITGLVLLALT